MTAAPDLYDALRDLVAVFNGQQVLTLAEVEANQATVERARAVLAAAVPPSTEK